MRQWIEHFHTNRFHKELEFYSYNRTASEIEAYQLKKFNKIWCDIIRYVPYYRSLLQNGRVPYQFESWELFRSLLPIIGKSDLQNHLQELRDQRIKAKFWRATGGSTGEPVRLPISSFEVSKSRNSIYVGRSWFGLTPGDRLFLLWGHSHLLGTGWKGTFSRLNRGLKDWILGYYRYSAYDLSEEALDRAGEEILKFRPDGLVGYSVALDRFARINRHRKDLLRKLPIKVVIATAESFPSDDSSFLLQQLFGCPITMEYGSVETGPIAYQNCRGTFSVFWNDFFLEVQTSNLTEGSYELLVTSLYPRCVPLIRYRIGDLLEGPSSECNIIEFRRVIGRCNDWILAPSGKVIHSEAFSHVVRDIQELLGFQIRQLVDGKIIFSYVSKQQLPEGVVQNIRSRLFRIDPSLSEIPLHRVPNLEQTIAGKTKIIYRIS